MDKPKFQPGDPYCSACGYQLKGSTESGRCPECGKPLVESMQRYQPESALGVRSVRRRSEATVFGWPVYDIAFGPDPLTGQRVGRAKGLIAVGDVATGGIAVGGMAIGIVSFGGIAIGVASLGGMAVGLLSAAGGCSLGGIAVGGMATGGLCTGGMAIGAVASGGMAIGVYARGGMAIGQHTIGRGKTPDAEAVKMFDTVEPIMGASLPGAGLMGGSMAIVAPMVITLSLVVMIGLIAITMGRASGRGSERA